MTEIWVTSSKPPIYSASGPRVDGSIVQVFHTKKLAVKVAKFLGWPNPAKCVSMVHTRFQVGYALSDGCGFLTIEGFRNLYEDCEKHKGAGPWREIK